MNPTQTLREAFESYLAQGRTHYENQAWEPALQALAQAHILGQRDLARHARVHGWMLRVALARRDTREAAGQVLRLLLVPLGHLTGRLPIGNTGRANVSAFEPMPIPPDLQRLLDRE